jgi:N-acetylneuraminic acid mutarotase
MKTKFISLLLSSCLVFTQMHSQNVWTQKANFGGTARNFSFGFSIGAMGYIGAGLNGAAYANDFWQYNPATNTWAQMASITNGRAAAITFVIGSKAYVCAGAGSVQYNDLQEYDPALNLWTAKANLPAQGRYGGFGFSINGMGYAGGGNPGSGTSQCLTDFYEYNPATNSWLQKANFPGYPRYGMAGIAIGNNGYAGLGLNQIGAALFFNDWFEYSPVNNVWATKANLPATARNYPFCFVIGNTGYLGGGENVVALNDFWSYDATNDAWQQLINFGGGNRWSAAGFSIGNFGYAGTGSDFTIKYNDFWEYSPLVGINESHGERSRTIIGPSPTNGNIEINFQENFSIPTQFEVYSTQGKKVFSKTIASNQKKVKVDLKNLCDGVYFYSLTDAGRKIQNGKFQIIK